MGKILKLKRAGGHVQQKRHNPQSTFNASTPKCYSFIDGGEKIYAEMNESGLELLIPSRCGEKFYRTGATESADRALQPEPDVEVAGAVKVGLFEATAPLNLPEDKMPMVVRADPEDDKSEIVDYKNVVFEGFASTFENVTPEDRDGDYIMDGAFNETINDFKKNPIMLTDHVNSVHSVAGSYDFIGKNAGGLAVRGRITNAPDMKSIRFKVAEGHIKALSIGGMFQWIEDRRGIEKVDLFEISLVAVPANPDALVQVRGLDLEGCRKAYKSRHAKNACKSQATG